MAGYSRKIVHIFLQGFSELVFCGAFRVIENNMYIFEPCNRSSYGTLVHDRFSLTGVLAIAHEAE